MTSVTTAVASSVSIEWTLGIAGAIIMLLLSANGFWIKRLVGSIDKLRENLEKLTLGAVHQEEKFIACQAKCGAETEVIIERLDDHDEILKKHGEDIAILKNRKK